MNFYKESNEIGTCKVKRTGVSLERENCPGGDMEVGKCSHRKKGRRQVSLTEHFCEGWRRAKAKTGRRAS